MLFLGTACSELEDDLDYYWRRKMYDCFDKIEKITGLNAIEVVELM